MLRSLLPQSSTYCHLQIWCLIHHKLNECSPRKIIMQTRQGSELCTNILDSNDTMSCPHEVDVEKEDLLRVLCFSLSNILSFQGCIYKVGHLMVLFPSKTCQGCQSLKQTMKLSQKKICQKCIIKLKQSMKLSSATQNYYRR